MGAGAASFKSDVFVGRVKVPSFGLEFLSESGGCVQCLLQRSHFDWTELGLWAKSPSELFRMGDTLGLSWNSFHGVGAGF